MPDNDSAVVDNLVTQFSSPLHCFRELVQNSIDAGSPTVDVWTEFIEGEGHEGTIALHVDDYGEGMDEAIIDQEFTRLFASSKEQDLTKIGQFGIGFVSTFALDPEAILVETGRSGEYWEVLFHEDRSFTKKELDVPVEGTQITIFLKGDVHRYGNLIEDIHRTLKHWCSHSDTEVTFEDRTPVDDSRPERVTVNEAFEVDGYCPQKVEHEGTQIAVAYSEDPTYGFFNRGLTLAHTANGDEVLGDERAKRLSHIAFKIKSRYLEHTLSRETVMRDANYEKAMAMLESAVNGPLYDSLIDELAELVGADDWSHADLDRYRTLLGFLAREPSDKLTDVQDRDILRLVDGDSATLSDAYDAWNRDGRVLVDNGPSELSSRLQDDGIPVFLGLFADAGGRPVVSILGPYIQHRQEKALLNRVWSLLGGDVEADTRGSFCSPEEVYIPVVVDDEIPDEVRELIQSAADLLDAIDAGYPSLTTCVTANPETDPPLFVLGREPGELMARPPESLRTSDSSVRPHAAVNREHPHFQQLADLADRDTNMAAYCLAKSLLLTEDRLLEDDARLVAEARGT